MTGSASAACQVQQLVMSLRTRPVPARTGVAQHVVLCKVGRHAHFTRHPGHADNAAPLRRRFTNTLAIMVWLSVAWIAYEMYYKVCGV